MKKILTLLLFILTVIMVSGQGKIGESYYTIKDEFSDPKYDLRSGAVKETNIKYIALDYQNAMVVHYFKDNVCMLTAVLPYSYKDLMYYYNLYNEHCEVDFNDKPTSWEYLDSNRNLIEIEFVKEDGKYYFIWYKKTAKDKFKVTKL